MTRARRWLAVWLLAAAAASAEPLPAPQRSSDGRFVLAADNVRRVLIARDAATGAIVREMPVVDREQRRARVAAIVDAAPRLSFVVLLAGVAEAWELLYDPNAAPVYEGLVHDFRMGEGIASTGPLPRRRIVLERPLTEPLFAPDYAHFIGRAAAGELHVVHLDVRRKIRTVNSDGDPRPAAGAAWLQDELPLFALPDAAQPRLLVLDTRTWRWREPVPLPGIATGVRREADGTLAVTVGARTVHAQLPER